jgi:putative ABC transport system permease protein
MGILLAMEGAVSQGVLWGLMTLGVYLTFRILNIADMTVDGSFAVGGAVTAVLISCGMNPVFSLLFAFIIGSLTGFITGFMNTKLKINILLASILTQIALYSINIRIMGKSNIPLLTLPGTESVKTSFFENLKLFYSGKINRNVNIKTIMTIISDATGFTVTESSLLIGGIIVVIIVAVMYWFFGTELGSSIRATGNNEHMSRALGVNTDNTKILGLMVSNGLVALSGALVAQSQGYADVSMGTGAIVVGLASIIIGEVIFGSHFGFWYKLLTAVLGSIIYRIVIAVVLQLGLKSTDLKLLTALIVAIALSVPVFKNKIDKRRRSLPGMNLEEEENTRHTKAKDKHEDENQESLKC